MLNTVSVALVVRVEAKPEMAYVVAALLSGAGPLAEQEEATPVWLALRTSETTFWVVDAFADDAGRQAHIEGKIAATLLGNADRLLASPPEILPADVLASKVVATTPAKA